MAVKQDETQTSQDNVPKLQILLRMLRSSQR